MKTFVCGSSHVNSLSKGARILDISSNIVDFFALGNAKHELKPFYKLHNGEINLTIDEYCSNLQKYTGLSSLNPDYRWGFCMGTHNARIYRNLFWCEAEPAEICLPKKRPISLDTLDACVESDQCHIRGFLSAVKSTGLQALVVACPPPRSDYHAITSGVRKEVIRYIDRRARQQFTNFLHDLGISYVDYPPEAEDEAGFLKEEYFAPDKAGRKDPHHGNVEYGKLMVQEIVRFLEN